MTRRYVHSSISNLHEAVSRIETNSATVAPEPTAAEKSEVAYVN
jgi:hypothetical protein